MADFTWTPKNNSSSMTLLSLARVLAIHEQAWEKVSEIFVIGNFQIYSGD